MKYIDAEKLIERLEEIKQAEYKNCGGVNAKTGALYEVQNLIESLQQEQPLEGKQVIIIAETDGDANIHWDCRSLDDVKALLASAKSFIADKQVEELRGIGSGPDYNTEEGRFRNAHKFQQNQPEVDLDALVNEAFDKYSSVDGYGQLSVSFNRTELYSFIKKIARKKK